MKQLWMIAFLSSTLFATTSFATMSLPSTCPETFVGKVESIADKTKSDHSLMKLDVTFENLRTISGEIGAKKTIKLLRFGSLKLEEGKTYMVALRNEKICSISSI